MIGVPRDKRVLRFFPPLNEVGYNPGCDLAFADSTGRPWRFRLVHYNSYLYSGRVNRYALRDGDHYTLQSGLCPVTTSSSHALPQAAS